jgi:ketosteroid isomerase-like protein
MSTGRKNAMDPEAVLDTFFAAIERADMDQVAALYSDDVSVWHSNDNITQSKTDNLRTLGYLTKRAAFRYIILERVVSGESVAQRHSVELVSHSDGRKAVSHAAIFFTVRDGKVCRIDEYIDSGSVGALAALLS